MEIRIECACGTPYEFEVEPVDGQMPCAIVCPTCGADGTEQANAILQQQLAPVLTPEESAAESGLPRFCHRHATEPFAAFCLLCKRPICEKCMRSFGYFCSPYCRERAKAEGMEVTEYKEQDAVVVGRRYQWFKALWAGLGCLLLALAGVWVWYNFYGSKPHIVLRVSVAGQPRNAQCQFIAPDRALLLADQTVSVIDTRAGRQVWSIKLSEIPPAVEQDDGASPNAGAASTGRIAAARAMRNASGLVQPKVAVANGSIWIASAAGLIACDSDTGKQRRPAPLKGPVLDAQLTDVSALMTSIDPPGQLLLTLVDFATGQFRTAIVPSPLRRTTNWESQPRPMDADAGDAGPSEPLLYVERDEIVPAGNSAVLMSVHLVEKKFVAVQTIKSQGTGATEKGDLGVKDTLDFAQDILNDMARQRGGGVRQEDASRYSVRLQRLLVPGAADWNGEVTGSPSLFSLSSVDLLVAGKTLLVFDKSNKKLWDSQLTYPVGSAESDDPFSRRRGTPAAPAIERGGSIYFFDRGILTAFDRSTGVVRWRLPSVGISRLQLDDQGMLYVSTTSRSQESIQYSEQVSFRDRPVGMILKVDPASGQLLWKAANVADQVYLAGRFVYGTRSQVSNLELLASHSTGKDVPVNFRIFRINAGNGEVLWTYYQPLPPVALEFQGRTILWLAGDELRILRFLSL